MAVRIRLKKTGTRNSPCFRVVVMDIRRQRDGKALEYIGFYDPRHQSENIDLARVDHWISCGAQPSETVNDIIFRAKNGKKLSEIQKAVKPSKKVRAKAAAAASAAAGEEQKQ